MPFYPVYFKYVVFSSFSSAWNINMIVSLTRDKFAD